MSSIKSLRQPLSSALLLLSAGLLVFACEKEAAAPLQPRAPLSVQIVSGDLQSGPAGKELPNPLVVKVVDATGLPQSGRSEEHTSELQSPYDLVCRLLLEK